MAITVATVAVAAAISVYRFYMPQTVTVAVTSTPAIRVCIDYSVMDPLRTEDPNGTRLDWGTLPRGVSATHTVTVFNEGDYDVVVYLVGSPPPGWTLSWDANGTTVSAGVGNFRNSLTLTVPQNAEPGVYDFDTWILVKPAT